MQELSSEQQAGSLQEDGLSDRVEGHDVVLADNSVLDCSIATVISRVPGGDEEYAPVDQNISNPSEQLSALADPSDDNVK